MLTQVSGFQVILLRYWVPVTYLVKVYGKVFRRHVEQRLLNSTEMSADVSDEMCSGIGVNDQEMLVCQGLRIVMY